MTEKQPELINMRLELHPLLRSKIKEISNVCGTYMNKQVQLAMIVKLSRLKYLTKEQRKELIAHLEV